MNHGKTGGLISSWVKESSVQSVPCLPSHDKLIGSKNPCHVGGLVRRQFLLLTCTDGRRRERWMKKSGSDAFSASISPRRPLIPKFIATPENLQALSDWFQEIGVKQYSLLTYNPTRAHKAESIGKKMNPRLPTQMLTSTELEGWRQLFTEYYLDVSEYPLGG